MNVTTIVTGTTSPVITAVPQSRRKSQMIKPASSNPMMIASRTLSIDSFDDVRLIVERLHVDAGRQRRPDRCHFLWTSSATSTVLLSGCRLTLSSTAGLPLAVTAV